MGMPINSYFLLNALAQGRGYTDAIRTFEPYSLIAFILHDPKIHSDFDKGLADLFERLDYVTGDKLLFFALVDPPQSWIQRAKEREYYKNITSWETRAIIDPSRILHSANPSLTMFALMNSLGIAMEDLPCMVVTNNLISRSFYHFSVNKNTIVERMTELGFIAEKLEPRVARQMSIHEIFRKYGFRTISSTQQELSSSLAKTLSDALSFFIAALPLPGFLAHKASNQAKSSIQELYKSLNDMKNERGEGNNYELDQLATKILSFMSLLNQKTNSSLSNIVPIEKELLEHESYQILRTASKVYELLISDQSREINSVLEMTNDFSPGVISLSKVFEREANLSVVHWVRKQLGIDLPQYYDKYEPGKNATIGKGDFNQTNIHGYWLPPGIGQSEFAMRNLSKNVLPDGWDDISFKLLMKRWAMIRELRNAAAHDRITDMQSLLDMKNALVELAEKECFRKFYEMKLAYSGRTHAS